MYQRKDSNKMNASQGTLFPIATPACDARDSPSIKLPFKQWKLREGERLYNKGAPNLSNTELLAYLTRDHQLAERLMRHFGTLEAISDASIDELQQVNGVGCATAEMIVAAFELGRRGRKRSDNCYTISSPQSVVELLSLEMKVLTQEEMRIVLLDTRNNVRKIEIVSKGTLDSALVHARDVFREAIKSNAKSIILAHKHPSGSAKPSSDDCNITKKLVEAGKVIGIEITDHVIIAGEDYFSFKERGML
jgi:DNA repair protein RadC